jgi:hypothetical protein
VYSNFCEIPLPALCFEKTEEIDIDKMTINKFKHRRRNDVSEKMTLGTLLIRKSYKRTSKEWRLKKWHAEMMVWGTNQKNNAQNKFTATVKKKRFNCLQKLTSTMSTVQGGDQINIEADVHRDDVDDDLINDDANDDGNDQDTTGTARVTGRAAGAARNAAGGAGQASFNLRVEQNKIPEFFSSKGKDTISAADFICRLEDLAKTNYHFANSLRNPAREWLSSVANWDDDEHD